MKRIIILVLLFASFAAQAQNIKGKVCYQKDRTPVQFSSVALLQLPDSSMVTGVITLTDGGYTLEKVKPGNYFVKASFVGYHPSGKVVEVTAGKDDIPVDTIFLSEVTTALNEVTVTAERIKGKEMVDRTVYSVPEVIAKSSSNGYDILKKIPQITVDFQNNITLNGSKNFIIQVDGRQRDREYLARLLPSDIQSIEIINNPSGKYEGNIDGVLNIILKKEARYGMSGNVAAQLKPFNKLTSATSGSLDYSAGKTTFYVTALAYTQALHINTTNINRFSTLDSLTQMSGKGNINVWMASVNTGMDYYVNDKNNISFNINLRPVGQDIDMPGTTNLYRSDVPLNTIYAMTTQNMRSDESSASLFYKKNFSKPVQELTAEASYYWFGSDQKDDFTNITHPYGSDEVLSTYGRREDDMNSRDYFSAKLDYVQPIGLYTKFETGYQLYYQHMGYDFNINSQEDSNLFKYAELRNSFYGGMTFNLKKLGFQAMLRVENSHIEADSVSKPDYACLLPAANVQYKFSASHNLKLTYNRRINRPGIYDMNPYRKVGQDFSVSQGNPDLRPDYRDRLQLTYTWNFGSNYFSPYVYDEFFSGKIGTRYSLITSHETGSITTITKPYNIIDGYELGGGVNAMLWVININARVYKGHYSEFREGSFTIPSKDYFSWSANSTAYKSFGKNKKTTAFAMLQYSGVTINAQSKTYSLPLWGFGGQQQIKNHSFGVLWLLPFYKDVNLNRTETETPAFRSTNTIGFDVSGFVQFMYSYKFNKGRKAVRKLDRKVEVESDSKTQGIGR
jgi:hypothetical protein